MQGRIPTQLTGRNSAFSLMENEIDLRSMVYVLLAEKKLILASVLMCLFISLLCAVFKTPEYRADVLLQLEEKHNGLGSLGSSLLIGGGGNSSSSADIQTVLIRSQFILIPAIENLGFDLAIKPHYFPIIGALYARFRDSLGKPIFGLNRYAWGGEDLKIESFSVPSENVNKTYKLTIVNNDTYQLYDSKGIQILQGTLGKLEESKNYNLRIKLKKINANAGAEFFLKKLSVEKMADKLADRIKISDLGPLNQVDKTGVLKLSLIGPDAKQNVALLNEIALSALKKDGERKSAEAAKTLKFLNEQLPIVKGDLNSAESALIRYRARTGNIDLLLGSQAILRQLGDVQKEITKVNLNRSMLMQNYTNQHPFIIALDSKRTTLEDELNILKEKLKKLPASDQVVVNLMRDVKVKSTLYLLLLNKIQELQVIKAGTVSDVRILKLASLPDAPIPGGRIFIVIAGALIGFVLGISIIFVRKMLNPCIQDPNWLEQRLGIPTFAIVPYSKIQNDMMQGCNEKRIKNLSILAQSQPRDVTIEALRSLRTSLQFALIGAKNNIISIMGVSPGIGKSFVAINFSYILADCGKRTLLIDGDMRRGYLKKYFANVIDTGLSDAIAGTANLTDVIQKTHIPNLDFISTGKYPPNPSELLMHAQFKNILNAASENYDLIIIDTPPVLAVTDCTIIGSLAAVNFLLLGSGKHQAEEIELAVKRLQGNGVTVQGSIFNNTQARDESYIKTKYNYYYSYESS